MLGSSFPPLVCSRAHVLLMLFVFVARSGVQHVLIIWVTWRVSYERQELPTLREQLNSPRFFKGSVLINFLFLVLSYYVSLRSDFRVATSVTISAWKRWSVRRCLQLFLCVCLIYVIFLCLRIVVSNTYSVVLCFVCLRLMYPSLPFCLVCPFVISPSVFSTAFFKIIVIIVMLSHVWLK